MEEPIERGEKLAWSQDALDALAEVTALDLLEADSLWRQVAPAQFKKVLGAQADGEAEPR